jgi:ribosomal protein L22
MMAEERRTPRTKPAGQKPDAAEAKKKAPVKEAEAKRAAAKTKPEAQKSAERKAAPKKAAPKKAEGARKTAARKPGAKKEPAKKEPAKKQPAKTEAEKPKPTPRRKAPEKVPEPVPLIVRASAKYVRVPPRKARLVADQVRGLHIDEARALLRFSPRGAAEDIRKLLDSAAANAENNHDLVADEMRIAELTVDEGPTLRRFRPRAMGRATRIDKRTSHIAIALTPEEE